MVPENRKKRLLDARGVVASKRARQGAEGARLAGTARVEAAEGPTAAGVASGSPATESTVASPPFPLQAREVPTAEEPRAHTTCKRCAADVPADAAECWNCGLVFRSC